MASIDPTPLPPLPAPAILRAIVAVDEHDRVQCQQPGCGHSIYAAIHVVEEAGQLLVLGSTCFARRYGNAHALGTAHFGSGGGRRLTDAERAMLLQNTQALLAQFEAQARAEAEAEAARRQAAAQRLQAQQESRQATLARLRERQQEDLQAARPAATLHRGPPALAAPRASPWPWQLPGTSVALLTSPQGRAWIRVQHRDGSQKLVPWPHFPGWETALPPTAGEADPALGAIAVADIVAAIRLLQAHGFQGPVAGAWQQVMARRPAARLGNAG